MRALCIRCAAALTVAAVLAPGLAGAATTAPLSSIATLPAPLPLKAADSPGPVAGLTLASKDLRGSMRWHELSAATGRGYCLASREGAGNRWMSTYGTGSKSQAEDLDLDRLVEKDGVATLERTRVHLDPDGGTIAATGRSHVELKEIARSSAGVVVWAYHDGPDLMILSRHAERGMSSRKPVTSEDSDSGFVSSDGCPFAAARLDGRKPEVGAVAQLSGALPAKGKGKERVVPRFIVDASVSRVTRDPEPLLAVRVRMVE